MWGRKGHFRKLIPSYLKYYRRDFHPWQHDNRAVLEQWKKALKLDEASAHQKVAVTAISTTPAVVADVVQTATPTKAPRARKLAALKLATQAKAAAPKKAVIPAKAAKSKAATLPPVKPRSLDKPANKVEGSQKPAQKPMRKPNPAN